MSIDLGLSCFAIPFTMLFAYVLSVSTGVGGCGWPISTREFLMDVYFWKFSNNPPNSASMADAMTFLVILNYTYNGPFSGGIAVIGVLLMYCERRGEYSLALLRAYGSDI